mmetsp:Transcript_14627/g.26509  ORF Transcript_14627/g.26509 Transcript_14627/m.26509 type:complete len:127 (-) Transcript_14627:1011-1391(-)
MVTRCVAAGQPSPIAYAGNFLNITTIFLEPRSKGGNGKEETTPNRKVCIARTINRSFHLCILKNAPEPNSNHDEKHRTLDEATVKTASRGSARILWFPPEMNHENTTNTGPSTAPDKSKYAYPLFQ